MRGSEKVILIFCIRLQTRPNVIGNVFLSQILDIELGCARFQRLLLETVELGSLTDISGYRNDLTVIVVFLQPRNDNGGIQASLICKYYLFDIILCHFFISDASASLLLYA